MIDSTVLCHFTTFICNIYYTCPFCISIFCTPHYHYYYSLNILSLPLCLISQSKLYFQAHLFYQAYTCHIIYLFRPCKLQSAAYVTLIMIDSTVLCHFTTFICNIYYTCPFCISIFCTPHYHYYYSLNILSLPLCLISQSKLYFQTHLFYQAYLPQDLLISSM